MREIWPYVYHELKELAQRKLARENRDPMLQPAVLVHEAFIRMASDPNRGWQSRAHFFGAASEAMRRILIDHAREKNRLKRRATVEPRFQLDWIVDLSDRQRQQLQSLDEALDRLEQIDETKATLVKLKFFVGLTTHEAARVLDLAPRTAERYWSQAREWLHGELCDGEVEEQ